MAARKFLFVHFAEFDPAAGLADRVSCYWGMSVAADVAPGYPHQIVPDGCISIVCARPRDGARRAVILGPRIEALTVPVQPGDQYWGVRFWPDAGGAALGMPARALRGAVVPLTGEPAWARALAARLHDCADEASATRAGDEILGAVLAHSPPLDAAVRAAIVGLIATRGEMGIAELAAGVGLSPRQLERRFGNATGLTPKQFARIRRVRSALSHLLDPTPRTWSEVAAELGYADQSHLVRDMGSLAGLSPTALAAKVRAISHGRVRP